MYITYKHRGTTYHVAACENCRTSVTITDRQFYHQTESNPLLVFGTLECCDSPRFLWAWEDKQS